MDQRFQGLAFGPADILLPQECEYSKWAVVACDQYVSQPEYWAQVEQIVGGAPSTLRLILPESCLDGPNVETDIVEINNTMTRYLRDGKFRELSSALIYVERTLRDGKLRRGLVGALDLEQYDYEPNAQTPVRATEGTVMSRIPPRVAVRKNAPIELPHAMLLCDDPERTVIEPLAERKGELELLYDFDLMTGGGHLSGWLLDEKAMAHVAAAFQALNSPQALEKRYGSQGVETPFQFAVGDGNHSLTTAKECYERQKKLTPPEKWGELPSRYALCEVVNLYDDSLEFKAIHRVLFNVKEKDLLDALLKAFPGAYGGEGPGHVLRYIYADGEGAITVPRPTQPLPVGTLQSFLDGYTKERGGSIDYIHGMGVTCDLARQPGNLGFVLPALSKVELFPAILSGGVLPRKTFSMGEAHDKRYYLEARKIR